MPHFGEHSLEQLDTCDERLQHIATMAIQFVDFRVEEGHRDKARQDKAFAEGKSQTPWPKSKHNKRPSRAFDFVPYPVDWADRVTALSRFTFVAGVIHACARQLGIKIRFGWDWNRNLDPRDETFLDWGHVELDEP
jgi:peptidoglycan LD-endopeptidase CwlK